LTAAEAALRPAIHHSAGDPATAITSINGQHIPRQARPWRRPKSTLPRVAGHPLGGSGTVR
jgi:hypothetical protein